LNGSDLEASGFAESIKSEMYLTSISSESESTSVLLDFEELFSLGKSLRGV
jgi:hypothetical protein